MRPPVLAFGINIAVGVLLYFALTQTLLVFTVTSDSLLEVIEEVVDGEDQITQSTVINFASGLLADSPSLPRVREYSVITGAERLYETGDTIPATAIVLFSVIFPILKLLSGFVHAVIGGSSRLQRFFVHFHRLSMLDVFIAATVVFVIGRSTGYEVELGIGFYFFLIYWAAQYLANAVLASER